MLFFMLKYHIKAAEAMNRDLLKQYIETNNQMIPVRITFHLRYKY